MRHDDYVYQGEFEQSDYWTLQRAENRKRLDEFRERRGPEIEAERRAIEYKKQLALREKLAKANEEFLEKAAVAEAKAGVRYPLSGVGPAFVVPGRHETLPRYIRRWVAFVHGVKVEDIDGPRRYQELVRARQHVFYELRARTNLSSTQIGRLCGNRDHTTVLHGIKKHAEMNGLPHIKVSDHWNVKDKEGFFGRKDALRGPDGTFIKEVMEAKEIK